VGRKDPLVPVFLLRGGDVPFGIDASEEIQGWQMELRWMACRRAIEHVRDCSSDERLTI